MGRLKKVITNKARLLHRASLPKMDKDAFDREDLAKAAKLRRVWEARDAKPK